jgi:glycogen synthase
MVTPRFLPHIGGVERHVDQVACRLSERGVSITVLTTDPAGELPPTETINGVRVKRVRAWPRERDYYLAPQIYSEIVHGDWDVVHVQSFHTLVAPLAMFAASRSHIPYVLTFHAGGHSSPLRNAIRPLQFALIRPLLSRAARLIALTRLEIDQYSGRLRLPSERFVVIPNGSDLCQIEIASNTRREPALIASLGRLERYKGHHRVIAALPHVLRRRPEARLWIVGAGPYENALRRLAESLGISSRIDIRAVPIAERDRLAQELSRVKVAVSLSEFETQPIALLEALALGCRLVVADTPGLSALANEGLARAVPINGSPEQVAAAILDELERPPIAEPPKLSSWDDCADALLEVYAAVSADA